MINFFNRESRERDQYAPDLSNEEFTTLLGWTAEGLKSRGVKPRVTLTAQNFPIRLNFYDDISNPPRLMGAFDLKKEHLVDKESFLKELNSLKINPWHVERP